MDQIVDTAPALPILDILVPLMGEQLVDVHRFFDALCPGAEQVIEVPKVLIDELPARTLVREPQLAEHLVEVPTIISFSSLQRIVGAERRHFQLLVVVELVEVFPVFSQDRIYSMTAEQIVDNPVPRGSFSGDLQGFPPGGLRTRSLTFQFQVEVFKIFLQNSSSCRAFVRVAGRGTSRGAVQHGHVPEHPHPQAAETVYYPLDVDDLLAARSSRPDRLLVVSGSQERVLRRTVEQIVDCVPVVPSPPHLRAADGGLSGGNAEDPGPLSSWREGRESHQSALALHAPAPPRSSLPEPQVVEQLVEVPIPLTVTLADGKDDRGIRWRRVWVGVAVPPGGWSAPTTPAGAAQMGSPPSRAVYKYWATLPAWGLASL